MNTTPLEYPELWGLERTDKPGQLVRPMDGNSHEDEGALVYFSRDAAEEAAKYQLWHYEVDCTPRRITAAPVAMTTSPKRPQLTSDCGGGAVYIVVDPQGRHFVNEYSWTKAKRVARQWSYQEKSPFTACRVLAPINGECQTIPLLTFSIDAPHEWMIYREPSDHFDWTWSPINACADVIRFPTEEAAERYIEDRGIENAYPWPVPKLTS